MVHARFWVDDGLLFPYRIGEELPTKRPQCETWARMSHPDANGAPDRRPIKVGEVWENPVTGERSVVLERPWDNPASRVTGRADSTRWRACDGGTPPSCSCGAIHRAGRGLKHFLRFGGRDGIRTHDLLIANSGENKLRQGATIT